MEPRYDEYGSRDTSQPYAAFLVAVDDELSAHAAITNAYDFSVENLMIIGTVYVEL